MWIICFSFLVNYKLSECKDYILFIFKTFPAINIILNVYDRCSINICWPLMPCMGFPGGSNGKQSAGNAVDPGSIPSQEDSLERGIATHSGILAWSSLHGQRSLVSCSPWDLKGGEQWPSDIHACTLSPTHTTPCTRYKDIVKWNKFQFSEYIGELVI